MQAKSHCRTEQGEERIQQEKESPQKGQSQIPQGTSKEDRRESAEDQDCVPTRNCMPGTRRSQQADCQR